jgi:hypothetical protein
MAKKRTIAEITTNIRPLIAELPYGTQQRLRMVMELAWHHAHAQKYNRARAFADVELAKNILGFVDEV